jgi:26S proteasome regulatory subunit N5
VIHYLHEEDYVEVSNCYAKILGTRHLNGDENLRALTGCVMFLLLSPVTDSQRNSIRTLLTTERRRFDDIVIIRDFAKSFLGSSLITGVDDSIRTIDYVFGESKLHADRGIGSGASRFQLLSKRIVQFNLLCVLSKFYSRIRLTKLASILGLSVDQAEIEITNLVSTKSLSVKIDRPAGIVCFHPRMSPQDKLDQWASKINRALDLVESTSNLIQKEIQLNAAKEKIRNQMIKDAVTAQ